MEGRANYLIDPIEEIGNGGYGVAGNKLFNTSHHLCGLYARKLLTSGNSDKDVYFPKIYKGNKSSMRLST